jgi:hypothetical protein
MKPMSKKVGHVAAEKNSHILSGLARKVGIKETL